MTLCFTIDFFSYLCLSLAQSPFGLGVGNRRIEKNIELTFFLRCINTKLNMRKFQKLPVIMLMTAMVFAVGCTPEENKDYENVDLGLPSGTLWATCNVGATTPEGYGNYFAWGETESKTTYNWSTYRYCDGQYDQLTKYCTKSNYGYNGFIDNLKVIQSDDDAATANWGNGWRVPTKDEWQELLDNTTSIWTTQNGVKGILFTASNGNSLFLPAAGYRWDDGFYEVGSVGDYWSGSLYTDYPHNAWDFYFRSDSLYYSDRAIGLSVRAVRSARQN